MDRKTIYNPRIKREILTTEEHFGGNPDGMINFTRCKYEWATKPCGIQWKGNTWFPKEVQMTQDAKDYKYLTAPEKRMYDLVLISTNLSWILYKQIT